MKKFLLSAPFVPCLALTALLAHPQWAHATPLITDHGASILQTRMQAALTRQAALLSSSGITLEQSGNLIVEPANAYYAITTPNLKLIFNDKSTRTIGMLAINAIPTEKPDIYKMAIAIPTPMPSHSANGTPLGTLSIGQQSMNGIYNFSLHAFTELSATYNDVTLQSANGAELSIPSLVTRTKLSDTGQGLLTGPRQTNIQGLRYKSSDGNFAAQSIDIRLDLEGFDTATHTLVQTEILKPSTTPIYERAFGYLLRTNENFNASINAAGLRYGQSPAPDTTDKKDKDAKNTPHNSSAETSQNLAQIASATLKISGKDLNAQSGSLKLSTTLEGIKLSDTLLPEKLSPTRFTLQLDVNDLPAFMSDTKNIHQAFLQSQSNLTLRKFKIDTPNIGILADGTLAIAPKTPRAFTANSNLTIRGMDEAIAYLTQNAQTIKLPAMAMAIIGVVQLTGTQGTDDQGRATRTYALAATPDGTISLNGAPLLPPPAQ